MKEVPCQEILAWLRVCIVARAGQCLGSEGVSGHLESQALARVARGHPASRIQGTFMIAELRTTYSFFPCNTFTINDSAVEGIANLAEVRVVEKASLESVPLLRHRLLSVTLINAL